MSDDRSVSVHLKANVASYVAGIEQARLKTVDFAKDAQKSAATHKDSWDKVGKGMLVTGGAVAAGVALEVKAFADFDVAMSRAQAGTMATGKSLDALRAAAIKAGADTMFSATEAADAITAMGKAGVSTKDILGGGLKGALDLAAAGQLDVGQAAEIAATAMNQFGLSGKDIPHIADLLAAGAGKAMGSVEDLSMALKFAGVVAAGAGWSIEETTGVLAEFAQAGIKGEQAGTSLRGIISGLTAPSAKAAGVMKDLGINMYDTNGHMVKAAPLAGILQGALGKLSEADRNQALGQIFGNEQLTAAQVLYKGGAGAVDKWTKGVNDQAYATRQAAMLTDNWKGDLERLGGSLSSVFINGGSAANGMLRGMTKNLQGVVDLYGSLPVPVQKGATVFGAVAGAASLVTGGLLVMAPKIAATKSALGEMGRTGALLSRGLSGTASVLKGPVGIALAAGVIGLGYFAKQAQESKARVDELTATLDTQTGALTENTRNWVAKNMADSGMLESAKQMGVNVSDVTSAVLGNADALARVNAALVVYGKSGPVDAQGIMVQQAAINALKAAIGGGNSEVKRGVAAQKLLAEATTVGGSAAAGAVGGQKALSSAEQGLADASAAAKKAIDDEVQSLQDAGLAVLSTRSATRALIDATNAAAAAHKKNGDGLSLNTVKGRANQDALDAQASAALNLSKSIYAETGSEEKMRGSLIASRASLIKTYLQFDNNIGRAKAYADSVLKIPAHHLTTVELDKAAAEKKAAALQRQINLIKQNKAIWLGADSAVARARILALQAQIDRLHGKNIVVTTTVLGRQTVPGTNTRTNVPKNAATGGPVFGEGSGTSDSIPAMLSNGEYVIRASQTAKYGPLLAAINEGVEGFARGGQAGLQTGYALAAGGPLPVPVTISPLDQLNHLKKALA